MKTNITDKELGGILFNIHKYLPSGEIYYLEKDLLPVLEVIGLPSPVFGENISLEKLKKVTNNEQIINFKGESYIVNDDTLKVGDNVYIPNGMMQFATIEYNIIKEMINIFESLNAKKIIKKF